MMESLKNENELANVIGHEIGHVLSHHLGAHVSHLGLFFAFNLAVDIAMKTGFVLPVVSYIFHLFLEFCEMRREM